MKSKNLKVNVLFNFLSQVLTLIIPLITTPYLSRVLHEEGNGQISYSLSIITIFVLFSSLGFTTYGQREIAKVRDDKTLKSKVFWEIVISKFFTTILSACVFFCFYFTIGFKKCDYLILIFSIEIFSNIFDITFLFYGEENFKSLAIRTILFKLLGLILIFCFVKTENDTWIYALCLSLSLLFSYLIMWPSLKNKISFIPFKELSLKRHFVPALRIFLPQLAVVIFSTLDKSMIGWFSSNSDYDNGCYEQAYKINSAALLLVTVISPVFAPRNAYDYEHKNMDQLKRHLNFSIHYTWMIGLPLIAGFYVLAGNLCTWYLGSGYDEVPLLLKIMSIRFVSSGFSELCGNQLFIAIGKEKSVTIATFFAAFLNCILNYFFITWWGAIGAAISTAICECVVALILIILSIKEKLILKFDFIKCLWKYLLSSIIMFVTIYFIQKVLPNEIWSFCVIVLIGGIEYFLCLIVLKEEYLLTFIKNVTKKFHKKKE
ncbi:MAG: flippase [Bacilli bacterium]